MSNSTDRSFALEITLPADPDAVWRALTEPAEIGRWFADRATVEPGPGGTLEWIWDAGWRWPSRIADWQPGHRLLLAQVADRPSDANGQPIDPALAEPRQIAMEFTLHDAAGGGTRLRLVHSGFGHGTAWDDELDGISHGWPYELRSLAHYLGHHRGAERALAQAMVSTPLAAERVWEALVGAGLTIEPADTTPGDTYTVRLGEALQLSGELLGRADGRAVFGTAAELGDGLFRVETWRTGGVTHAIVALASWTEAGRARLPELRSRAEAWVKDALASLRAAA